MKTLKLYLSPLVLLFFLLESNDIIAQSENFDTYVKNSKKVEGFFNFYEDEENGKVFLEVDQVGEEFLYYSAYARGVGANDIGLDRGRLGTSFQHLSKVVKFDKQGNKILLIEKNLDYRASGNNPLEKRAVKESFASSVLFGFDILAKKGNTFLIDLTPFILQDRGAASAIKRAGQGDFSLDKARSAVFFKNNKSFPKNTEFEAVITLSGTNPGPSLQRVTPSPDHVTMHQHFSFVELPDDGYKMRTFDPRMGFNSMEYEDYSAPIHESMTKKVIRRHRLIKKHPERELSEPVKPIVYYIDNGAPELIKNALMEGAQWWNEAFEAAGFKDAFQVKVLPADADPSDIRYNVVQWVHRSTRGWSYGSSIMDPRTGEILKGEVTLDSRRVRQDYLIAQGLKGNFDALQDDDSVLTKMALNRIKQLSAHELGHTLGLAHNFIGSIYNRASVMDYPAPKVDIVEGQLDLSDAYAEGIGEFDKITVNWGYREFPKAAKEEVELAKIVENAKKEGFEFLTDKDARPLGSVHPQVHLWDNGSDIFKEFDHVVKVRAIALKNFDEKRIPKGTPYANLEEVLVPIYMFHRFMTEAVAKSLGGAYYSFGVKGDPLPVYTLVSAKDQNRALDKLLATLDPDFLALSEDIIKLIPPRAFGYEADPVETFKRHTGLSFDPLTPAESSAQVTFSLLLNPERVSRLANQKNRQSDLPSLKEVLKKTTETLWGRKILNEESYKGQISRITALLYLTKLLALTENNNLATEAKIDILETIHTIKDRNKGDHGLNLLVKKIFQRYENNPESFAPKGFVTPPNGQPIDQGYNWLD